MVVTISTSGQPETTVEFENIRPWHCQDVFVVTPESPFGPETVKRMASATGQESYEIINVREGGIYALVVRKSLLGSYAPEDLTSLLRPLVATGTICGPLAGIRVLSKPENVLMPRAGCDEGTAGLPLTVGAVMQTSLTCTAPDETVGSAADKMSTRKIGCLPVLENDRLVGLVTSRDLRRVHPNWLVRDVMTTELVTVPEDAPLWEAQRLMEEAGIERVLVTRGERLVGIVTKADLLKKLGYQTDPLTGLSTSSYLRAYGQRLLQQGKEVAIIFIDLNNFGQINKVHGHVFGDRVLQRVARVLQEHTERETDLPCRYGGDEFVILTTRVALEAHNLAQRVLSVINGLQHDGGITVSACAGIAGGRRLSIRPGMHPAATLDSLINLASLASTQAKKQRTATVFAGEIRAAG